MVYQIPNNVIDLNVCSISFQRHSTSLLNRRIKNTNTLYKRSNMAHNLDRHPLPVVELRPFSKKVWRREKSLPDFYDKKSTDETNSSSNLTGSESHPSSSRLVRDFTEIKRSIESRQGTFDSALGKYRNHPKAEFQHESTREWRKQDFIPSFITRFERTKTSFEPFSRENTLHRINLDKTPIFETTQTYEPHSEIKINGGRMNPQIHRRHLLYLNPQESYKQANSWVPTFNSSNPTRQNTSRDKYFSARHSFPLTSSKTKDLIIGESQAHYPLKPIRREDVESPHKFNNKLGAARNSLEVLSKVGAPTKLEKNLEKEMEFNLERYRKDRILVPGDFKGLQFHCLNFDTNLTAGELSLRSAREANKAARGKKRLMDTRKTCMLGGNLMSNEVYNSFYENDLNKTRDLNSSKVNPILHPISNPLVEESETRSVLGHDGSDPRRVAGVSRESRLATSREDTHKDGTKTSTERVPNNEQNRDHESGCKTIESVMKRNHDSTNPPKLSATLDSTKAGTGSGSNDVDHHSVCKGSRPAIDSSRIETNVAYLENLQLKSSLGDPSTDNNNSSRVNLSQNQVQHGQKDIQTKLNVKQSQLESHRSQYSLGSENTFAQQHQPTSMSAVTVIDSPVASTHNGISSKHIAAGHNDGAGPSDSQWVPNESKQNVTSIETSVEPSGQLKPNAMTTARQDSTGQRVWIAESSAIEDSVAEDFEKEIKHNSTQEAMKASVELKNFSPMTSSGFESQPTTDHEDESPTSDEHFIVEPNSTEELCCQGGDDHYQSDKSYSSPKMGVNIEPGCKNPIPANSLANISVIDNGKETKNLINSASSSQPFINKRAAQNSPLEDEGISMVPAEPAMLDSSNAEVCSDQDGLTGCMDNGDSGVSTTFLTSEESVPEVISC